MEIETPDENPADEPRENAALETPRTINPPTKWTPEDAANFISTAIRETQKPALDAMRRRGVSKVFYALTCLFFIALLAVAGVQISRLTEQLAQMQSRYDEIAKRQLDEAIRAGGEKIVVAAESMKQTAADSRELVSAARWREQLETARKENQTQELLLQAQKEKIAALTERLANAENETAKANAAAKKNADE